MNKIISSMTYHTIYFAIIINIIFWPLTLSYANPINGKVIEGKATISRNSKKLEIHQSSTKAVIDWKKFNIRHNETTQFYQPSSRSVTLNRVQDENPSTISGKIIANGNIILVNPNGIFFSKKSKIDVNGIVATTANINPQNFMQGSNLFNITCKPDAKITNKGIIKAKDGGLIGLVAPNVENNGIIFAKLSRVQLSSADTVSIDFYGDDLLKVAIHDDEIKKQLVKNTGDIINTGGTIAITAAAATQTINSLIEVNGTVQANSVALDVNGNIIIAAAGTNQTEKNGTSKIKTSGFIDASGIQSKQRGGKIKILADEIYIKNGTLIDASGHSAINKNNIANDGSSATIKFDESLNKVVRTEEEFLIQDSRAGGSILIGGDYQGQGNTQTAKYLSFAPKARIFNHAIDNGDAGRTILWADRNTKFFGNIYARGGIHSGNGGFVETSGKINLQARGQSFLEPQNFKYHKGTHLFDPTNITIYGNFQPNFVSTGGAFDLDTSLRLWMDATDAGTITTSGNRVTNWTNKKVLAPVNDASGSGNVDSGTRTVNGLNVIDYRGGYFTFDDNDMLDSPYDAYFMIQSDGSGSGLMAWLGRRQGGSPADGSAQIRYNNSSNTFRNDVQTADGSFIATSAAFTATNPNVLRAYYDDSNVGVQVNEGNPTTTPTTGSFNNAFVANARSGVRPNQTSNDVADGLVGEIIVYNAAPDTNRSYLLNQYNSAKWAIALDPPGTGGDEPTRAMANDGYNVFTTRYLERLSSSANISLSADTNIDLDLQGDTLTLTNDRNITLQTTSGNISTASAGSIVTNRTGSDGNISFIANGTGSINFDHAFTLNAQNSGDITLTANGGNINITNTLNLTNGNLTVNTDNLNVTGTISGSAGNFNYAQSNAGNSIDVGSGGSGNNILTNTLLANIQSSFSSYSFGRADGGNITNLTSSWTNPVTFFTNSNFINDITSSSNNTISVTAGGNVILNQDLSTTSATANAIQLDITGNYINNAGNNALSATNSNWVVYSNAPTTNTNNGLLPNQSLFGQANIATAIGNATPGNNLYAYNTASQPTLTYNVDNNSVVYGTAVSGNGITYASGLIGDDADGFIGQTGSANFSDGYTPGDNVATYNNQITASSGTLSNPLGYLYTFNPGDLTVTTANLTTSGVSAQNKQYDGTNAATLNGGSLSGVFGGDTVNISGGSGAFAQTNIGTSIAVSASSISLGGADAGNYTVTLPMGLSADITEANLSITGVTAEDKIFDGTTDATLNGGTLTGVAGGDTVTIIPGTGTFTQAEIGNNITVNATGYSIGGADVANYLLSGQPTGITANILAEPVVVAETTIINQALLDSVQSQITVFITPQNLQPPTTNTIIRNFIFGTETNLFDGGLNFEIIKTNNIDSKNNSDGSINQGNNSETSSNNKKSPLLKISSEIIEELTN